MKTLYIMCGVGFAGKSTLARSIAEHFTIPLVSLDVLWLEKEKEFETSGATDAQQYEILLAACKEKMSQLLGAGESVVFDNTNLEHQHRDDLRALAQEHGAQSVVVYLDTPEAVTTQRQEKNKITQERHDVPQHYLDQAKRELEVPTADENPYIFAPDTDRAVFLESLPH